MAQPGDEKQSEGQIESSAKPSKFGDYRCVFRPAADSLYIMMKNSKTKRTFTNTFSKSTLIEMDLKQPIDKIINLLVEAKSGTKQELSFKIGFGDAQNDKKVSFEKLSKSYYKGDALFIMVSIDNNYFAAQYMFKLLEQKRNEMDIVRDIIGDMQEEIDELKSKLANNKPGIASWYSTFATGGYITMNGQHLEPTLEGMVTLSQDQTTITIGMSGLYKVSAEVNFTSNSGAGHVLQIQVNGTNVGARCGSNYGGFGCVTRILNLKKDDTIRFNAGNVYTTSKDYSCFTIHKL